MQDKFLLVLNELFQKVEVNGCELIYLQRGWLITSEGLNEFGLRPVVLHLIELFLRVLKQVDNGTRIELDRVWALWEDPGKGLHALLGHDKRSNFSTQSLYDCNSFVDSVQESNDLQEKILVNKQSLALDNPMHLYDIRLH